MIKLFAPAAALALSLLAHASGATRGVDLALTDAWFRSFERTASGQVVLVAIEAQSLNRLGVWPWPRGYHAAVLDRLMAAGARRVAFDVTLSARSTEAADARLEASLAAGSGRVAIPTVLHRAEGDGNAGLVPVQQPLDRFAAKAAVASITVWSDSDGLVRQLPRAAFVDGEVVPFMATWLAADARATRIDSVYDVDFAISPNSLPRLSYLDILTGAFDPLQVAGRDVIVGSTAVELGGVLSVPVWSGLTGAGLIALGYESLLQERALSRLPGWMAYGFAVVLAFAVLPLFSRMRIWSGAVLVAGSAGALCAASSATYLWAASLVEVGPGLVVLGLGYAFGLASRATWQASHIVVQDRVIEERQMLLRAVFDHTTEGLVMIDAAGKIIEANPSAHRVFAYDAGELVGRNISVLVTEADADAYASDIERYRTTSVPRIVGPSREVTGRRKDGETFPLDLSIAEATLRGQPVFIGSLSDLTQRKAAEADLVQAQKMEVVGQLAGGIAHDFNNLLTVILGNAEVIKDQLPHPHPLQPLAEMIHTAADRGGALTTRLLGFSRRQALQAVPLDVDSVVRGLHGLLKRTLGEHIDVREITNATGWKILADQAQLENALLNLAINARDAMPNGGRLVVETAKIELSEAHIAANPGALPGEHIMISVADTGEGIPPELLRRVFEPFFTTKEVGKGTGLGLSMVYGFIRQSSGHIAIESEVGRGTTLRIYLPRLHDPSDNTGPQEQSVLVGNETILLVEDEELVRQVAGRQMRDLGYMVVEAADGPAALRLVADGLQFDLLVTDVIMPQMNGRSLAEAIRDIRPGARVLYASGYPDSVIVHHGRLDHDVLLLRKPYRRHELARKLREALEGLPPASRPGG